MNDQKIILASLAMDLKRIALGLHRNSFIMAERFTKEALQRKNELNLRDLKPYLRKIVVDMEKVLKSSHNKKKAEDILMYSTLFQNYTQK